MLVGIEVHCAGSPAVPVRAATRYFAEAGGRAGGVFCSFYPAKQDIIQFYKEFRLIGELGCPC